MLYVIGCFGLSRHLSCFLLLIPPAVIILIMELYKKVEREFFYFSTMISADQFLFFFLFYDLPPFLATFFFVVLLADASPFLLDFFLVAIISDMLSFTPLLMIYFHSFYFKDMTNLDWHSIKIIYVHMVVGLDIYPNHMMQQKSVLLL
jgi:hypothetical protein